MDPAAMSQHIASMQNTLMFLSQSMSQQTATTNQQQPGNQQPTFGTSTTMTHPTGSTPNSSGRQPASALQEFNGIFPHRPRKESDRKRKIHGM